MTYLDGTGNVYDKHYDKAKDAIITFDSSYSMWKFRALKINEWRYWRKSHEELTIDKDDKLS